MFLHIKCLKQFIAACCLSCIYFRCLLCGAIVACQLVFPPRRYVSRMVGAYIGAGGASGMTAAARADSQSRKLGCVTDWLQRDLTEVLVMLPRGTKTTITWQAGFSKILSSRSRPSSAE